MDNKDQRKAVAEEEEGISDNAPTPGPEPCTLQDRQLDSFATYLQERLQGRISAVNTGEEDLARDKSEVRTRDRDEQEAAPQRQSEIDVHKNNAAVFKKPKAGPLQHFSPDGKRRAGVVGYGAHTRAFDEPVVSRRSDTAAAMRKSEGSSGSPPSRKVRGDAHNTECASERKDSQLSSSEPTHKTRRKRSEVRRPEPGNDFTLENSLPNFYDIDPDGEKYSKILQHPNALNGQVVYASPFWPALQAADVPTGAGLCEWRRARSMREQATEQARYMQDEWWDTRHPGMYRGKKLVSMKIRALPEISSKRRKRESLVVRLRTYNHGLRSSDLPMLRTRANSMPASSIRREGDEWSSVLSPSSQSARKARAALCQPTSSSDPRHANDNTNITKENDEPTCLDISTLSPPPPRSSPPETAGKENCVPAEDITLHHKSQASSGSPPPSPRPRSLSYPEADFDRLSYFPTMPDRSVEPHEGDPPLSSIVSPSKRAREDDSGTDQPRPTRRLKLHGPRPPPAASLESQLSILEDPRNYETAKDELIAPHDDLPMLNDPEHCEKVGDEPSASTNELSILNDSRNYGKEEGETWDSIHGAIQSTASKLDKVEDALRARRAIQNRLQQEILSTKKLLGILDSSSDEDDGDIEIPSSPPRLPLSSRFRNRPNEKVVFGKVRWNDEVDPMDVDANIPTESERQGHDDNIVVSRRQKVSRTPHLSKRKRARPLFDKRPKLSIPPFATRINPIPREELPPDPSGGFIEWARDSGILEQCTDEERLALRFDGVFGGEDWELVDRLLAWTRPEFLGRNVWTAANLPLHVQKEFAQKIPTWPPATPISNHRFVMKGRDIEYLVTHDGTAGQEPTWRQATALVGSGWTKMLEAYWTQSTRQIQIRRFIEDPYRTPYFDGDPPSALRLTIKSAEMAWHRWVDFEVCARQQQAPDDECPRRACQLGPDWDGAIAEYWWLVARRVAEMEDAEEEERKGGKNGGRGVWDHNRAIDEWRHLHRRDPAAASRIWDEEFRENLELFDGRDATDGRCYAWLLGDPFGKEVRALKRELVEQQQQGDEEEERRARRERLRSLREYWHGRA